MTNVTSVPRDTLPNKKLDAILNKLKEFGNDPVARTVREEIIEKIPANEVGACVDVIYDSILFSLLRVPSREEDIIRNAVKDGVREGVMTYGINDKAELQKIFYELKNGRLRPNDGVDAQASAERVEEVRRTLGVILGQFDKSLDKLNQIQKITPEDFSGIIKNGNALAEVTEKLGNTKTATETAIKLLEERVDSTVRNWEAEQEATRQKVEAVNTAIENWDNDAVKNLTRERNCWRASTVIACMCAAIAGWFVIDLRADIKYSAGEMRAVAAENRK